MLLCKKNKLIDSIFFFVFDVFCFIFVLLCCLMNDPFPELHMYVTFYCSLLIISLLLFLVLYIQLLLILVSSIEVFLRLFCSSLFTFKMSCVQSFYFSNFNKIYPATIKLNLIGK